MDCFNHKLRMADKARKQFQKEKDDYLKAAGFCPYDPFLRGFAYGWEAAHAGWMTKICAFGSSAMDWLRERVRREG